MTHPVIGLRATQRRDYVRSLRDIGLVAEQIETDDSKPLAPIISSLMFALVVIGCAATVVTALIVWEVLS